MPTRVGPKGQVVIEQRIREALGIQRGALAVQRLAGDHVEIHFLPPPQAGSQRGALKPLVRRWPDDPDAQQAREAWAADWRAREGGSERG